MDSSRRNFLVAGMGLPAVASASRSARPAPQAPAKRASDIQFGYRILGKTGLKVTSVKCADCPECTVQCPHGVRVVERLTKAQELFAS